MTNAQSGAVLRRRPRVPRATVVAFSFVSAYGAHVAIPLALGRRGPRLGWADRRPGRVNRIGFGSVALGAVGLAWCYVSHYSPGEQVPVSLVPEHLLTTGPYRLSRNPIYVSEQAMWLGWSWFFGSPVVAGSALLEAGPRAYIRDLGARAAAVERSGAFGPVTTDVFRWEGHHDPAALRSMFATFAAGIALSDPLRTELLDDVERLARDEFGRTVHRPYQTRLYLAQRLER